MFRLTPPDFWYQSPQKFNTRRHILFFHALRPFSKIYQVFVSRRLRQSPRYQSSLPVICVGNLTVGGTGKTPLVQWLVQDFKARGFNPAVLLRGYGGTLGQGDHAHQVDSAQDTAKTVGDEALSHASYAPVFVARNRGVGARAIENAGQHDLIIMDDGLQNTGLGHDIRLCVVDSTWGFGNEACLPAGPLREALITGLHRCDALIMMGKESPQSKDYVKRFSAILPVLSASVKPLALIDEQGQEALPQSIDSLTVFSGIGRPEKVFESLESYLSDTLKEPQKILINKFSFPDHHAFTPQEIKTLVMAHNPDKGAFLVTSDKDWQRLPSDVQAKVLRLKIGLDVTSEAQNKLLSIFSNKIQKS